MFEKIMRSNMNANREKLNNWAYLKYFLYKYYLKLSFSEVP